MKRGLGRYAQAGGTAGLIGLILLFLVLYILFLPPEDRAELLGDTSTGSESSSGSAKYNTTIFTEALGRIDYLAARDVEKNLPNIFLEERRDARVLKQFNAVYVKNGIFDKKQREVGFSLENMDSLENAQLVFAAKLRKGILSIDFNGQNIFESQLDAYNAQPINLDKSLLKKDNVLRFSVSGVGARFWATNEYILEDLKIVGNIVDTSGKQSESLFTLTGTEFFNLEEATLRFVPYCGSQDVGRLEIFVNSRRVYSSSPVCDDPYTISLAPTMLSQGANKLSFMTEKGSYSVEQIRLTGRLKDSRAITRFFEVDDATYKDIKDNRRSAWLSIVFVDDREEKEAEININGYRTMLDQRNREYRKKINSWIQRGNNYISVTPLTTLYIVDLQVALS